MTTFELTPADPDDRRVPAGTYQGSNGSIPPRRPGHVVDSGITVRELMGVLRRNAWIIVAVSVAVFAGVAFLVSREVPQYRATAAIRWVDPQRELAGGISGAAPGAGRVGADPILSQIEVLRGREVVGVVVDREGLQLVGASRGSERVRIEGFRRLGTLAAGDTIQLSFESSGVRATTASGASAEARYGAPLRLPEMELTVARRPPVESAVLAVISRDAAIDRAIEGLVARPRPNTDAVDVQFTAADPGLAQRVVNASIDAFREVSATTARRQSRRRREFLEQQLVSVDSTFESVQARLSAFRGDSRLYSSQEKITAQQSGLMSLDTQREELATGRTLLAQTVDQLQRAGGDRDRIQRVLGSSPAVAGNPVLSGLHAELLAQLAAQDSLTTGPRAVTAQHPEVQRIEQSLRGLEARILEAGRNQLAAVDARIASLDNLRSRYAGEITELSTIEADEGRLIQQLESARAMSDQLRTELQRARIAEAVEAGGVEIINYAPAPNAPLRNRQVWKLALGLAMGLLLGGGAALFRESLNTSIRRREEVEELLHVPGLAVIPRIAAGGPARKLALPGRVVGTGRRNGRSPVPATRLNELITVTDLHSSGAEAFRMLRTNLLFSNAAGRIKSMVVTSATPGEGKTTTAANLAATFAQQGLKVLLIDCDLRRSRVHRLFDTPLSPGLTDLLIGSTTPQEAIRQTEVQGLSVLPAGTLPPNPSELLGGARMRRILELFGHGFDFIVLDTPPLMAASDAAILGAGADGVLLVVRAGQTERSAGQFAMQQLNGVGARVVGAVLNDPDAQVPLYGGHYYYDYYGASQPVG